MWIIKFTKVKMSSLQSIGSTGSGRNLTLHSKASPILVTVSVTSVFSMPGLTNLSAASLARWAAMMTSAFRPVTGASALAPRTKVWAATAINPSI